MSVFTPPGRIQDLNPRPPGTETYADLRHCPSKKTKSKKQTNDRVYHQRVSLKIHALLDPSVP